MQNLESHAVLNKSQFGFRAKCYTKLDCQTSVRSPNSSFDSDNHILGAFLDLATAFVSIDSRIFFEKLERCGIRGVELGGFKNYFFSRQ